MVRGLGLPETFTVLCFICKPLCSHQQSEIKQFAKTRFG